MIKISENKCLAIATDLDGTLISSDNTVSCKNLCAIQRLSSAGIKIILLTGRTYFEIPEVLRKCKSIDYIIYSNGAAASSRQNEIIFDNYIDSKKAAYLFDLLSGYDVFTEIYADGAPYVDEKLFNDEAFSEYRIDKGFIPEMHISRRPISSLKQIIKNSSEKIEMFDVFFKHESERLECAKLLENDAETEVTSSMTSNLEIISSKATKGNALKRLCSAVGINIKCVIVIGDSKNDISAFKTQAKKYAVSNACSELKALADKVICSNDENIFCCIEKELL